MGKRLSKIIDIHLRPVLPLATQSDIMSAEAPSTGDRLFSLLSQSVVTDLGMVFGEILYGATRIHEEILRGRTLSISVRLVLGTNFRRKIIILFGIALSSLIPVHFKVVSVIGLTYFVFKSTM